MPVPLLPRPALRCLATYRALYPGAASAAHGAELDSDMPLMEHAFQTAEACRLAHPEADWLHLVGLLHGLGKLLAHPRFGGEPQWPSAASPSPSAARTARSSHAPRASA